MLGEFEISGLQKVTLEIAHQDAQLGGIFVTMYQKQNDEELLEQFRDAPVFFPCFFLRPIHFANESITIPTVCRRSRTLSASWNG